jgi:hypothetical protein
MFASRWARAWTLFIVRNVLVVYEGTVWYTSVISNSIDEEIIKINYSTVPLVLVWLKLIILNGIAAYFQKLSYYYHY